MQWLANRGRVGQVNTYRHFRTTMVVRIVQPVDPSLHSHDPKKPRESQPEQDIKLTGERSRHRHDNAEKKSSIRTSNVNEGVIGRWRGDTRGHDDRFLI